MRKTLCAIVASACLACVPESDLSRIPEPPTPTENPSSSCGVYAPDDPRIFRVNPNICLTWKDPSIYQKSLDVPLEQEVYPVSLVIQDGARAIYDAHGEETRWLADGECQQLSFAYLCHIGSTSEFVRVALISASTWEQANAARQTPFGEPVQTQYIFQGGQVEYDFGDRLYQAYNTSEEIPSYAVYYDGGHIIGYSKSSSSAYIKFIQTPTTGTKADALFLREGNFEEKTIRLNIFPEALLNGDDGYTR